MKRWDKNGLFTVLLAAALLFSAAVPQSAAPAGGLWCSAFGILAEPAVKERKTDKVQYGFFLAECWKQLMQQEGKAKSLPPDIA